MKNILKQISSRLNQETKLCQTIDYNYFARHVFHMLHLSLQYEDLAMQIIDKDIKDIILGIFHHLPMRRLEKDWRNSVLLLSILRRLAKRKEGEAIIIKHVHLLLRLFIFSDKKRRAGNAKPQYNSVMRESVSKLVQHKGIAQALITPERVELLVGALKQGKIAIAPLVLQCLFFENEVFAHQVFERAGWKMITKGLQLTSPHDMPKFPSLMHIAREMASKGEIQELVMGIINENDNKYILIILTNLVTYYIDIVREEFIVKGGIRFLLACLTSLSHEKKFQIITSCLFQKMALDIKLCEGMVAENGIQVFIQLLVVGLNDNVNNMYLISIIDIIRLLVKGLEDPMSLLMSSIDDIDVLEIHKALLCLPPHNHRAMGLSFLPATLNVNKNIAKELLNSSCFKQPKICYLNMGWYVTPYPYDRDTISVLIELAKHVDIATQIMAKEGILEGFVIQLSKGHLDRDTFELLEVVLQHKIVATLVVHQRLSFIKELLQFFPMEKISIFQLSRPYSVASLLFILAKHGDIFIESIVKNGGIEILLKEASFKNCIGHCNVIEVLGIMAKDENHALQIEKAGGSKMLLKEISFYLQYVHHTHLDTSKFSTPYIQLNEKYEDGHVVMCCLKTLSCLVNHEEIAKQISTRREDSKECGIIALVDVMQTASQLWSSITLTLHETIVTERLMQIKGHMLTILSNVASTLASMAKLHSHINISRKVNEDVLKGIFQLQGMVIDEHQELKEVLHNLLDIKKTWSCEQLHSKAIDIQSYEGKLGDCQAHFGVKGTSNEGESSGTTKEEDD